MDFYGKMLHASPSYAVALLSTAVFLIYRA